MKKKWPYWVGAVVVLAVSVYIIFGSRIWQWARNQIGGTEFSATIAMTNGVAIILWILLFVGAYYLGAVEPSAPGEDPNRLKHWRVGRNLFAALGGTLLGWAVTLAYTPFGAADAESLSTIIQTLSVFVSGYLLSKVDRFLEGTLFQGGKPTLMWVPLGLFVFGFLLSAIVVFVNRVYTTDVNRSSAVAFTASTNNMEILLGQDSIAIKDGKLRYSSNELSGATIKAGDFIKLNPRTGKVEINGRDVGTFILSTPKKEDRPPTQAR